MSGKILPDGDNVVRHIVATKILGDGSVDGVAFRLLKGKGELSVNWLEAFRSLEKSEQIAQVRRLIRRKLGANSRFAELEVGTTARHVSEEHGIQIKFCSSPLAETPEYEADCSHADIVDLPPEGSDASALVGDLIAECVRYPLHPAKKQP